MKTVDFLETIAAWDLNIGRCKQLDEQIKEYEYSMSMSFLDFGRRSSTKTKKKKKLKIVFLRKH